MYKLLLLLLLFITFITLTGCIQETTVKPYPEFVITPTYSSPTSYNPQTRTFTQPIYSDPNLYTEPSITFSFDIIPPPGSKTTDYDFLLFNAHNFDPRVFKHSSGTYQFVWTDNTKTYLVNGEKLLYMDDTYEITLTPRFDPNAIYEYSPTTFSITFSNTDDSWSESFYFKTIKL